MTILKRIMAIAVIAALVWGNASIYTAGNSLAGTTVTASIKTVSVNANMSITESEKLKDAVAIHAGSIFSLVFGKLARLDKGSDLVSPFEQNGVVMVPLRVLSEAFGAKVTWNNYAKTASILITGRKSTITLYSKNMTIAGKTTAMKVPAMTTGGRIFIPAEALAQILCKKLLVDKGLLLFSSTQAFSKTKDKSLIDNVSNKINVLPVIGTRTKLKELLEKSGSFNRVGYARDEVLQMKSMVDTQNTAAAKESSAFAGKESSAAAGADYSATNVQVAGVDEGDIVKTDGKYIFQVRNNKISISKVYPVNEMKLLTAISFDSSAFQPLELYVNGNKLVVIGMDIIDRQVQSIQKDSANQKKMSAEMYYPVYNQATRCFIYDVSDRSKPVFLRDVLIQGSYVSSRLVAGSLYIVSNQSIYNWNEENVPLNPMYKDSRQGKEFKEIPYSGIKYMPPVSSNSYLLIASMSVIDTDKPLNVDAYLGAGREIYSSETGLYVAAFEGYAGIRPLVFDGRGFMPPVNNPATLIYKFALSDGKVSYKAKGQVEGTILNQFSMDEYNGTFRVAVNRMDFQGKSHGNDGMENGIYIFDEGMNITGRLDGLAKGEKIYSVRFMGNRGYVVTFKTVDPLFVIDLSDKSAPKVLGALKIPGYSDYLHPYDENHLIGFGKDTTTRAYKDSEGNVINEIAYYLGMKVALFDVSDVANPKEKAVYMIGDRGTDSELLRDHKALLFDRKKGLLAFPVVEAKVMKQESGEVVDNGGAPQYGSIVFNGAYVLNIDITKGFSLRGKISHETDNERLMAGNNYYDYNKQIRRLIYIGNVLYGVSDKVISAHDLNSTKELSRLE